METEKTKKLRTNCLDKIVAGLGVGTMIGIVGAGWYIGISCEHKMRNPKQRAVPNTHAESNIRRLSDEYSLRGRYTLDQSAYVEKIIDTQGRTAAVRVFTQGTPAEGIYVPVKEFEAAEVSSK